MEILNYVFHIDQYLAVIVSIFGIWSYVVLFAIVFAETGLVITPFLPGDSLLFAVGALAGAGFLDIWTVYVVLLTAAVLGDTVNYWVGHHIGRRMVSRENTRLINKRHLDRTHEFYERHGGKTIILARFVPIIRTFAPFVAGIARMRYATFCLYNVVGAVAWVTSMTLTGYFFGGLPFIKEHFEYMVVGIILLSILPIAMEYIRHYRHLVILRRRV
jgi:membrane-associated protein